MNPVTNLEIFSFLKPHHFALAVDNKHYIEAYKTFCGEPITHKTLEKDGVEIFIFSLRNNMFLEILFPLNESNSIGKFIKKMGGGVVFHHIAYRVPNIREFMNNLREKGFIFIDEEPRMGAMDHFIAFIHPKSTNGVLVELVEVNN